MRDIVLTSCITISGSVLVFVVGQIISRFVLDPLVEFRGLVEKIDQSLQFYANLYTNAGSMSEGMKVAAKVFREFSCDLKAKARSILGFWLLEKVGIVPHRSNILRASEILLYLSNILLSSGLNAENSENNWEKAKSIYKLLGADRFWKS